MISVAVDYSHVVHRLSTDLSTIIGFYWFQKFIMKYKQYNMQNHNRMKKRTVKGSL